jgi:hypothetical protein
MEKTVMHSRHVLAFLAILAIGFAVRWLFFSNQTFDAGTSSSIDALEMQRQIKELPLRDIKDPI